MARITTIHRQLCISVAPYETVRIGVELELEPIDTVEVADEMAASALLDQYASVAGCTPAELLKSDKHVKTLRRFGLLAAAERRRDEYASRLRDAELRRMAEAVADIIDPRKVGASAAQWSSATAAVGTGGAGEIRGSSSAAKDDGF